jgi:hypothetical protein
MKNNARTRKELSDQYGVCRRTFNRWLKRNKIELQNGLITPKEQELIYSKLGHPFKSSDGSNNNEI